MLQVCSLPPSRLLKHLATEVHHLRANEVHVSAAATGLGLQTVISAGPQALCILSAPIFDVTALNCLPSIIQYLTWMRQLQEIMHEGVEALEDAMLLLRAERPHLAACVKRIPGPVLCSWQHSWQKSKAHLQLIDTDAKKAQVKAMFGAAHKLLVECSSIYEWALSDACGPKDPMVYLCLHQRKAFVLKAAADEQARQQRLQD